MDLFIHILEQTLYFYNEIAIYLVLGFVIAALLHILFPESLVRKHLGHNSFLSVLKSTAFGIPLPICSCGVVPVAASLKKSGASNGATVSFLISTPQIGADSYLITYSLLGWIFGVFRIMAALITALAAGLFVNLFQRKPTGIDKQEATSSGTQETAKDRLSHIGRYIEYELLGPIANALLIGIVIAGFISALVPENFFEAWMGGTWTSMLVMLVVGIPLYICASASTPIAASLILKGMSPGAALVFLLVGPATNAMSIATVLKIVGKRATAIYLLTIAVVSLLLGGLLNLMVAHYGMGQIIFTHQHELLPAWLKLIGSGLLLLMLAGYYMRRFFSQKTQEMLDMSNRITLTVDGMTCMHCAANVKRAVEGIEGAADAQINLENKSVSFELDDSSKTEQIKLEIRAAGYETS
ncbi:permease [Candidatus Venteria ishoeyi]|uniref:permease n=1 Tax=Candidatus Venteria ishoeyi TaxID=1899563 RepID=UPI0025A56BBA|nr:permease [Candidatus Venteria ishoeyi]MDM8546632.1 permease [Candidatus Venteria ishoeyi]